MKQPIFDLLTFGFFCGLSGAIVGALTMCYAFNATLEKTNKRAIEAETRAKIYRRYVPVDPIIRGLANNDE